MEQEFIPYNRWLHQHDEDIKKEFPDRPTQEMAREMDVNYYTVSRRATSLGVGKSAAFMHTSWEKGSKRKDGWKKTGERTKNRDIRQQHNQRQEAQATEDSGIRPNLLFHPLNCLHGDGS